jgi:hypothetical protein
LLYIVITLFDSLMIRRLTTCGRSEDRSTQRTYRTYQVPRLVRLLQYRRARLHVNLEHIGHTRSLKDTGLVKNL